MRTHATCAWVCNVAVVVAETGCLLEASGVVGACVGAKDWFIAIALVVCCGLWTTAGSTRF
jgi:hypothetical protein